MLRWNNGSDNRTELTRNTWIHNSARECTKQMGELQDDETKAVIVLDVIILLCKAELYPGK